MIIEYENNGKGRHMSVTASIDLTAYGAMCGYEITARGFGEDEEEAKHNLLDCITRMQSELSEAGAL